MKTNELNLSSIEMHRQEMKKLTSEERIEAYLRFVYDETQTPRLCEEVFDLKIKTSKGSNRRTTYYFGTDSTYDKNYLIRNGLVKYTDNTKTHVVSTGQKVTSEFLKIFNKEREEKNTKATLYAREKRAREKFQNQSVITVEKVEVEPVMENEEDANVWESTVKTYWEFLKEITDMCKGKWVSVEDLTYIRVRENGKSFKVNIFEEFGVKDTSRVTFPRMHKIGILDARGKRGQKEYHRDPERGLATEEEARRLATNIYHSRNQHKENGETVEEVVEETVTPVAIETSNLNYETEEQLLAQTAHKLNELMGGFIRLLEEVCEKMETFVQRTE